MPLRNEPNTLQEACMIVIAKYFNYICYNCKNRTDMSKMINDESYLEVEGPFQSLPSFLLTDLISTIESEGTVRHVRKKHLHALILPQLESVKLTSSADVSFGLQMLQMRCKKLRHLELTYLGCISPLVLIKLIPNFPLLTTLNLKKTETIDQVLDLIGKNCPHIRDLNVSLCPITDRGIMRLCYDVETKTSRCQKLIRLSVDGCQITPNSIWFLLQKIPTLRELDFENIFLIFDCAETNITQLETHEGGQTFHLSQLTSTYSQVTSINADIALTLCPQVTNVTLNESIISNEVFYKTMVLDYLTHLRITNDESMSLDFQEGILPVLTVKGNQLMSLLLSKFLVVDISAIGECCPHLKNLALSNIDVYEDIVYAREKHFNELNALEIWCDRTVDTVNGVILKQLLGHCTDIHNLLISGCAAVTDKLLNEIWETNPMTKVSRVTFDNCFSISRAVCDHFLDSVNDLTLFRIWSCFLIRDEDSVLLEKRITEENCDLHLDYYAWQG